MPYEIGVGYAIDNLVGAYFAAASQFSNGPSDVHVGFSDISTGRCKALPSDFSNLVEFNHADYDEAALRRLTAYIRAHRIELVMLLDAPMLSPLWPALRTAGVRCIIGYWGAPIAVRPALLRSLFKRARIELQASRRLDALVFECRAYAHLATSGAGCPPRLIDICATGAAIERFVPVTCKSRIHETFDLLPETTVVLYAGHVIARKGMAYLMDVAIELHSRGRHDIRIVVCGDRPGDAEPWQARLSAKGAADMVIFGGYRSDLPLLMPHAHIGVIPTTGWDSFPITSLEMGAAGLPLVVTAVGGLPEAVVDERTGFVADPERPTDMADKIVCLADDPALRASFGADGRKRIIENYSTSHQADRLAAIIKARYNAVCEHN